MTAYTSITIIYNPNSTGHSRPLAEALRRDLKATLPDQTVKLMPTKYAGHAEKLAYQLAKASKRPLIISSSGDGGYHEVVNGLMKAHAEGARPIAGLLPAGNANDHFHNAHEMDTVTAIKHGKAQTIDLLRLNCSVKGKPFERYAHSYIGVGLTPKAGKELNKTRLTALNQAWIVGKVLFTFKPVKLVVKGKKRAYDSLVFSNVSRMSKVLSVSARAELTDGKFEIMAHRRRSRLRLVASLLKASIIGLKANTQHSSFSFKTVKPTALQLDGEIIEVDARTEVTITIAPTIFTCIV